MHPAHITNSIRKSLRDLDTELTTCDPNDAEKLIEQLGYFVGKMEKLADRIDAEEGLSNSR
jgi:hypothetical protein